MDAPLLWALVFGVGLLAGTLNTLAGAGSLLTLPLLILVAGLPANVANGTNRVAVLVQCVAAVLVYRRAGVGGTGFALRWAPIVCATSLVGAWLATRIPAEPLQRAMGAVMLACIPLVVFSSRLEAAARRRTHPVPVAILWVVGALIGLYSGLLQAAVGIPMLLFLLWGQGLGAAEANHVKVVVIAASMATTLVVFAGAGQVDPVLGGIAAVGQGIGAVLGARLVLTRGTSVVRVALAIAVATSGLELLGVLRWR